MKKSKCIRPALFALLCASAMPSVAAQSQCTLQKNALPEEMKNYIQCLDAKLNKVTQQQNSWIQKRTYELVAIENETGNSQILSLFNNSITAKEDYIKRSCQWRYMLKQPNAPLAVMTYKECEIALIEQFTEQLKTAL